MATPYLRFLLTGVNSVFSWVFKLTSLKIGKGKKAILDLFQQNSLVHSITLLYKILLQCVFYLYIYWQARIGHYLSCRFLIG